MRTVRCAHIERARACAAEPPRATDSRMERIARAAELAGQRRVGLTGELPRVSAEPRQPPRP
eukprot:9713536-Alexandrium_andersonii.AAC.1